MPDHSRLFQPTPSPAYLRGIETEEGKLQATLEEKSPAYLRGIETVLHRNGVRGHVESPAYLRGIETLFEGA